MFWYLLTDIGFVLHYVHVQRADEAQKELNMTHKPTITRTFAGLYHFTGWVRGKLVQYSILKTAEGWVLTCVYGQGQEYYAAFPTKREAISELTSA